MAHVEAEIASQPACWRLGASVASGFADALPRQGERVAAVGCGTSWFVAMAYARLRERAGHGETDAYQASEFPSHRSYDRVLAISRSAATTEVIELLTALPHTVISTVVTADPDAPATRVARHVVPLPFADELAVMQTRFATTALAMLRAHLGEDLGPAVADAYAAL